MTRLGIAGVAAGLVAIAGVQPAHAIAIVNGSFETGPEPGSFTQLNNGSTAITGWTVGGRSIDYVGSLWTASDGDRSLDLSGTGAGNIYQTLSTVKGQRYVVRFDLAGNPDAGPTVKSMRVTASGSPGQTVTFDTTGATHADMNWTPFTYSFIAKRASTQLTFASLNESNAGPALDNVAISVPEAATWSMMLAGFGVLGIALRTRRDRHAQFG